VLYDPKTMNRIWLAGVAAIVAIVAAAAIKRFVRQKRSEAIDVGTVSEDGWPNSGHGRIPDVDFRTGL
jgi:hypothetical protein